MLCVCVRARVNNFCLPRIASTSLETRSMGDWRMLCAFVRCTYLLSLQRACVHSYKISASLCDIINNVVVVHQLLRILNTIERCAIAHGTHVRFEHHAWDINYPYVLSITVAFWISAWTLTLCSNVWSSFSVCLCVCTPGLPSSLSLSHAQYTNCWIHTIA